MDEIHTLADTRVISVLRGTAGLLALLVAWMHLLHPRLGFGSLLRYLQIGVIYDPRPPLFTLVSLLIFIGLALGVMGAPRQRLYLAGILLMGGLLLGYVSWHTLLDHGAVWPHIEAHPEPDQHYGVVTTLVVHLREDAIVLLSKVAELSTLVLLVVLRSLDQPIEETERTER